MYLHSTRKRRNRRSLAIHMVSIGLVVRSILLSSPAKAAVYGGGGINEGINAASGLGGITTINSITALIVQIITFLLDIVLILAVLALIVAGIYLIVSNGDETQKDKAKKIVFYAIAGIILILFSRLIIVLVNSIF